MYILLIFALMVGSPGSNGTATAGTTLQFDNEPICKAALSNIGAAEGDIGHGVGHYRIWATCLQTKP